MVSVLHPQVTPVSDKNGKATVTMCNNPVDVEGLRQGEVVRPHTPVSTNYAGSLDQDQSFLSSGLQSIQPMLTPLP